MRPVTLQKRTDFLLTCWPTTGQYVISNYKKGAFEPTGFRDIEVDRNLPPSWKTWLDQGRAAYMASKHSAGAGLSSAVSAEGTPGELQWGLAVWSLLTALCVPVTLPLLMVLRWAGVRWPERSKPSHGNGANGHGSSSSAFVAFLIVAYLVLNSGLSMLNRWALGMYGLKFPIIMTTTHMIFGTWALTPLMLLNDEYALEHEATVRCYIYIYLRMYICPCNVPTSELCSAMRPPCGPSGAPPSRLVCVSGPRLSFQSV